MGLQTVEGGRWRTQRADEQADVDEEQADVRGHVLAACYPIGWPRLTTMNYVVKIRKRISRLR